MKRPDKEIGKVLHSTESYPRRYQKVIVEYIAYLENKDKVTKREVFAMAAMQANRANPQYGEAKSEEIAKYAVEDADALLKELEK